MLWTEKLGLSLRQAQVDFVIPNISQDLNIYVDPFLFYRSKNPEYQGVHTVLHEFFSQAIECVKNGDFYTAEQMLIFPEVKETMLGQSKGSHKGRGMGLEKGKLIFDEIVSNEDVQEKGITHLAEMQLMIEGVGFDLISDMCTNIAKPFFVEYTQRQCKLHGIPLEPGLCLEHVFNWDDQCWEDILVDLPENPINGNPILLVPKSVVRRFPAFDYEHFWNSTYRYILREIERGKSLSAIGKEPVILWKDIKEKYDFSKRTVVRVLHEQPHLRHIYVEKLDKETKENVDPTDLNKVDGAGRSDVQSEELIKELHLIAPGNKDAKKYEALVLRILSQLFSPPLIDPKEQVSSHDGREIIDITFYNGANDGFWADVKQLWNAQIIVFEMKNMEDLGNEEFFQLAARLDDTKGFLGFLISRKKDGLDTQRAYRRLNKERKVTLVLTDDDLVTMLQQQQEGHNPTDYVREMYREFIDKS
ncbi:hypothetical protein ACFQUU_03580 [Herbaspirillum sp. GCM10030257]|uniref:hypothetical protein n=1 Tax=Herbaspirillum sp. GCM10030257 TaxID=3273393 RepID=UPI00361B9B27